MATIHTSGPATILITVVSSSDSGQFECQVKSWSLSTDYEETAEEVQYLGADCYEPAVETGSETISLEVDHDLTATGLYYFCQDNEFEQATFEVVPNTTMGTQTPAKIDGTFVLKRPSMDSNEYGARMSGTAEFKSVGRAYLTPAVDTP